VSRNLREFATSGFYVEFWAFKRLIPLCFAISFYFAFDMKEKVALDYFTSFGWDSQGQWPWFTHPAPCNFVAGNRMV
jgi:hypothetical protein